MIADNTVSSLEAEVIHIFREVSAEAENPVFLYSVGKDSAVMLRLTTKAFYSAKPPFSFLHVDTTWKFREMVAFRDQRMAELGLDLIVHTNPDKLAKGVGPMHAPRCLRIFTQAVTQTGLQDR